MKCKWKKCQLGDLITFQRGYDLPKTKMEDGIYPVVGSNGIIGYHNEYTTEAPSITIGRSGNVGKPFIYKGQSWSHNTTLYIKEFKNVDPIFVYYYLQLLNLANFAGGSAVPTLNRNHIHSLDICVPETINEQKKIAHILSILDDKIATNTAINKNLESQAQAIFKSWFVDFEPFSGEMPRDWKYGNLEDLGQDIVCGKTPSTKRKEYYGGNIPFVTIPDMHNQIYITETERYLSIDGVKTQPTKTLPKNTICVSCIGTAGLVSLTSKECQTNQQINSIIPKDHISPYYVYFLMKSLSETIIRLGGSGSTIVNLNKGQFAKIEVVIPNLEDMSKFTYIVKSNFEMILSNQIENTRLAALRDTLLPRLMSGEIDVGNVEV